MFRKFAVWTVVLVAVLSNDVLALNQGNSFTPTTGEDRMADAYISNTKTPMATTPSMPTPANEKTMPTGAMPLPPGTSTTTPPTGTQPLSGTPSATTPTVEKGSHMSDCDPNFLSEKPKRAFNATHVVTPTFSNVTPASSTPAVKTPATFTEKPTDDSVVTPIQPRTTSTDVVDSKTVSGNNEQTSQQANTQSGNQSNTSSTGTGAFAVVGLIAAVAAVGVAVSQVKKTRDADADAALVTPGENENIHIEIKSTPSGGSTIL